MMIEDDLNVGDNVVLKGEVLRVFFHNASNGYVIFSMNDKEKKITTIVKGSTAHSITAGTSVDVAGTVVNDPKFGIQVSSNSIKELAPSSNEAIVRYLANAGIEGIGLGIAKKIVEKFGDKTFDVIDKTPYRLSEINGIGKKRAKEIAEAYVKIRTDRNAVMYLSDIGLSPSQVFHAIKEFGSEFVVDKVKENPYILCDVFGIGFERIDNIAIDIMKMPLDHPNRIEAIIVNHIEKETAFGSVAIKYPFVVKNNRGVSKDKIDLRIKEMLNDRILVLDKGHIYLEEMYRYESKAAKKLFSMSRNKSDFSDIRRDDIKAVAETNLGFTLDPAQLDAIENSLKSNLSIITGGPGVGKTTVVSGLISVMESYGLEVNMCAPTGKAAKRMMETTGLQASTIHKLIGIDKEGLARFNESTRHPGKCFVLDESSMLDTELLYKFISSVSEDSMVVFVGDVDQLPSVGAGATLRDMINSGTITTSKLTKVFRQSAESSIITNATNINNGKPIVIDENKDDFIFIKTNNDEETLAEIKSYLETQEACGVDVIDDIQILAPMRKGEVGIADLNEMLPSMLNANKSHKINNLEVAVNDKVMQLANNYDKHVYNGDVGTVLDIKFDSYGKPEKLIVMFDDNLVEYLKTEADELTKAYAYSIHKSQGSQYPKVLIPLSKQHNFMWDKNLLYTAITRAESEVVLIGEESVLERAIKKEKSSDRITFLCERLKYEEELLLKKERFKQSFSV